MSDIEEFDRAGLAEAAKRHAFLRSTKPYERLVMRYLANIDSHNSEATLEAETRDGVKVGKTAMGQIYVELPGVGQVAWAQAVQQGLITVLEER